MKRFFDICRFVCISPEMFCAVLLTAMGISKPLLLVHLGELLESNIEALKYLISVPLGLLGVCIALSWNVLFPTAQNRVLLEWEGYQKLKDRVFFSAAVCLLSVGVAFIIWL